MPPLTCAYRLCTNEATKRCPSCLRQFCTVHGGLEQSHECVLCGELRLAAVKAQRAATRRLLLAGVVLGAAAGLSLALLTQQTGEYLAGFVAVGALLGLGLGHASGF